MVRKAVFVGVMTSVHRPGKTSRDQDVRRPVHVRLVSFVQVLVDPEGWPVDPQHEELHTPSDAGRSTRLAIATKR